VGWAHDEFVNGPDREIICIDCGGRAFLLTPAREDDRWYAGDVVAYRCEDCLDRWDIVLDEQDVDESGEEYRGQ
jgi:hypothetical protein